jgi:hypothetical protein
VLRRGRVYRLLITVNGATSAEAVGEVLEQLGFDDLHLATPDEWDEQRPDDWPDEPLAELAANECQVRASGCYRVPHARFERDTPVEAGATLTIAGAWDHGPAPATRGIERTGAAAPAKKDDAAKPMQPLVLVGLGLAGFGMWKLLASNRKEERDRERLAKAAMAVERQQMAERVHTLVGRGHSLDEASRLATSEAELGQLAEARGIRLNVP